MPPTAAIGVALTLALPVATAADIDVELVIMPQPRSTTVLPVASIPVSGRLMRLFTQYSPLGTIVAVAVARIVGAAFMNMPEKLSFFWIAKATRTAFASVVKPPTDGGFVTVQVVEMPVWLFFLRS